LMTRQAISPRFAIKIFENMVERPRAGAVAAPSFAC
jgi:hypothetical protein